MMNQETLELLQKAAFKREQLCSEQDIATDCIQNLARLIITLTKLQYDPNPMVNLYEQITKELTYALTDITVIASTLGLSPQEVNNILTENLRKKG